MSDRYRGSIEERYKQQARQAKQRCIEWLFTFETWMAFWTDSGLFHLRGKGSGKYVMARRGDVGPYSPDNCFVCPFEQNIRDGHANSGRVKRPAAKSSRVVRGWTYVARAKKNPYQVMCGKTYIGSFSTPEEAEAAYKEAREATKSHAFSFARLSLSTPHNELAEG